MSKLHYFAYGSNLHPVRLQSRVPSASLKGLVSLPGYRLCFHKRHHEDNSGKCNMFWTDQVDDVVHGAVYEMKASEKPLLDQCEGEGYRCDTIEVEIQSSLVECFVYIAEDSHINDGLRHHSWYQNIVLLGAEHHQLPDYYLNQIRAVLANDDPDTERHKLHHALIEEMKAYTNSF